MAEGCCLTLHIGLYLPSPREPTVYTSDRYSVYTMPLLHYPQIKTNNWECPPDWARVHVRSAVKSWHLSGRAPPFGAHIYVAALSEDRRSKEREWRRKSGQNFWSGFRLEVWHPNQGGRCARVSNMHHIAEPDWNNVHINQHQRKKVG